MSAGLTCQQEASDQVAVLRLAGHLDVDTAATARTALHKALAAHPSAIVVDLSELIVVDDVVLTLFMAFAHSAAGWRSCPVLLCAPTDAVRAGLDRMAITRAVPVYADRSAALATVSELPVTRRYDRALPANVGACGLARDVVDTACREWQLPHLADDAAILVTELVSNAVRHAGRDIQLQVVLGTYFVHLSVRDGSPDPPRRRLVDVEGALGGRGLLLVDALAAGWGSIPDGSGKIVWATLRIGR